MMQQGGLQLAKGQEVENQGFHFAAALSTSVERAEFKTVQEARQVDLVLTKYFNLPKAELAHRGMQISPKGILYKVMYGEQLMMVPHELRQRSYLRTMMFLLLGTSGSTG